MIKNLLLDMGGVILDVDYTRIIDGFNDYGIDASKLYTQAMQMPFVDEFEKGLISAEAFRNNIRSITKTNLKDEVIDKIWNSMILSLRKDTIELLGSLKSKYDNIFLFSNTNVIHMDYVRKDFLKQLGFDIFTMLFNKSYLSNEIHLRKPDIEAFEWVIKDMGVDRQNILFVDDTQKNIQGAKQCGLNAYLLKPEETLIDLYNKKII